MTGSARHVLLVEELELIVSKHVNAALKDELGEQHMPERLIVVATSNDASGLDEALLQRFEVFPFSAGPTFGEGCQKRLAWIWEQEVARRAHALGCVGLGLRPPRKLLHARALAALGGAVEIHRERLVAA